MNFKGFSLEIPECLEETTEGYAVMQHGNNYSLKLSNRHKENKYGKACDVDLWIDGENVGSFRISYGETITIERPTYASEKFVALKKDTREFFDADVDPNSSELGLIKAVFRPGHFKTTTTTIVYKPWTYPRQSPEPWTLPSVQTYAVTDWDTVVTNYNNDYGYVTKTFDNDAYTNSLRSANFIGGGTGLSGESKQKFNEIETLEYDEPSVTIYLRLAFSGEKAPIKPLKRMVYSTNVPKRLK